MISQYFYNPNQADPEFYMYINKAPLSEGEVKTILSNVEKGLTVQFDPALPLDQYESIVDQLTKGAIIYKLTKGGSND